MRRTTAAAALVFALLAVSVLITGSPVSGADLAENTWATKASMSMARSDLGVAAVNGKIYAIGGSNGRSANGASIFVGTNEEYDPTTNKWTFKKPMPTPRTHFAIVTFQNKIYCIGGYLNNGTITGINEVYDPATDTWETRAPTKTIRISLQANIANGKIYLIGGYLPAFYTTQNFTATPINEAYDPITNSWSTKTPIPVAVENYVSAAIENRIYVFGGVSNTDVGTLNQIYDAENDTWSQGAASPYPIYFGFAAATEGVNAPVRIYVLHQDLSSPPPDGPLNGYAVLHVYDPEKESWASAATLPTNRAGYGLSMLNDLLYAIGGGISGYQTYPDDWIYGPSLISLYANNEQYTPFGFHIIPTAVTVVSPVNQSYTSNNVSLTFAVNKPASWVGYSIDGLDNVTITGNVTLAGLSSGLHNVTVYAKDTSENEAASETITFNVEEPFATVPGAAVSGLSIAAVIAGLLLYYRKRRKEAKQK